MPVVDLTGTCDVMGTAFLLESNDLPSENEGDASLVKVSSCALHLSIWESAVCRNPTATVPVRHEGAVA